MANATPFYSNQPDSAGADLYHTHPHCRIAQGIALASRVAGMGEGRKQCPFCFVLGEFQANRDMRKRVPAAKAYDVPADQRPLGNVAASAQNARVA